MTQRTPLRPLARILDARAKGENPDAIGTREPAPASRGAARSPAPARRGAVGVDGVGLSHGLRVGRACAWPRWPRPRRKSPASSRPQAAIHTTRADITDRHGRVLATNFRDQRALCPSRTRSWTPAPPPMDWPRSFPRWTPRRFMRASPPNSGFSGCAATSAPSRSRWSTTSASRGLLVRPARDAAFIPTGRSRRTFSAVRASVRKAVNAAEVIGVAGIEAMFDDELRDPAREAPLALSLDLTGAGPPLEEVLAGGMMLMERPRCGRGADWMRIRAKSWRWRACPISTPNSRPRPLFGGGPGRQPAVQPRGAGRLRIGQRVSRPLPSHRALELGLYNPNDMIDTARPLAHVRLCHTRLFAATGPRNRCMTFSPIPPTSEPRGIAQVIGGERQRAFLEDLGLLEPAPVEIVRGGQCPPALAAALGVELSTMDDFIRSRRLDLAFFLGFF